MYEFAVTPAVTQIRRRGVEITSVAPDSIAFELELEAGDRVIKVNGRPVRDYLDFRFQTGGETELVLDVLKRTGEEWEVLIERGEGEDFGLGFENIVPRQCANECLFCFCKGNPPDARPALFFRDEDVRLSFLYGNYTTLTSITEQEMRRVVEQRLSPQYVSVHATDLSVRAYLDRKSTRLNSSHANISYAVFCLKKKINYNFLIIYNLIIAISYNEYRFLSTILTADLVFIYFYHFICLK